MATVNRQIADSVSGITNSGLLVLVALQSRQTIKCLHGVARCFLFVFFSWSCQLVSTISSLPVTPTTPLLVLVVLVPSSRVAVHTCKPIYADHNVFFGLFCVFLSTISRNCKVDQQTAGGTLQV